MRANVLDTHRRFNAAFICARARSRGFMKRFQRKRNTEATGAHMYPDM